MPLIAVFLGARVDKNKIHFMLIAFFSELKASINDDTLCVFDSAKLSGDLVKQPEVINKCAEIAFDSGDYKKSYDLYKYLHKLYSKDSGYQYKIALHYIGGFGIERDIDKALVLLNSASDNGYADAMMDLAGIYLDGVVIKKDEIKAATLFDQVVMLNTKRKHTAAYHLATLYYNGRGVKKNYSKAFDLFQISADGGYDQSLAMLGKMYVLGQGVDVDINSGLDFLERVALNDDVVALQFLVYMYTNGDGVEIDKNHAKKLHLKAAKLNSKVAQSTLGAFYLLGAYGEKNIDQALYWLKKAAIDEYRNAQRKIASIYYNGTGLKVDYNKACYWYMKAVQPVLPIYKSTDKDFSDQYQIVHDKCKQLLGEVVYKDIFEKITINVKKGRSTDVNDYIYNKTLRRDQ